MGLADGPCGETVDRHTGGIRLVSSFTSSAMRTPACRLNPSSPSPIRMTFMPGSYSRAIVTRTPSPGAGVRGRTPLWIQ
jgi:hypothetical protein